jgi:hypothetical protein
MRAGRKMASGVKIEDMEIFYAQVDATLLGRTERTRDGVKSLASLAIIAQQKWRHLA